MKKHKSDTRSASHSEQARPGAEAMSESVLPRAHRYHVWNVKAITLVAVLAMAVIATAVFFLGHESLFKKVEITLGLVAASLYLFLALGLYFGIRVRKEKLDAHEMQIPRPGGGTLGNLFSGGLELGSFDADGCVFAIGAILLAVVLAILFYLFIALVWPVVVLLFIAVFWIFNRALRQVFIRSRVCKGNIVPSLGYAFFYTFMYTGWLFIVTWGAHRAFWRR
jgi:hypothetical protein